MKAAIYSRKSMFTGKGESIENQISMCENYIKTNFQNCSIEVYQDEDFSGKDTNRPQFKKMMKDVKDNKINVLICYRLDRISRNVADFSAILEILEAKKVAFVSINERFDTSTPIGKAMVYISSVFAQLERETLAERVRDNMLQLAKTGRWLGGQSPLGFESEKVSYYDAEMKQRSLQQLKPNNEELKLVKLIYNKYIELGSISLVLKYLLSNRFRGKNGGEFASMSINDILRNPVYAKSSEAIFDYFREQKINCAGQPNGNGILLYNKRNSKYIARDKSEWIAAVARHKGIIDADMWLQVQKQLDKNAKKPNPRTGTSKTSLLSGVLKCACCGAPMRVSYGRKKKDGTRIYYYTCTMKAHSGKTRCDNPNIRGDELETSIIENIKKLNSEKVIYELEQYKKEAAATTSIVSKNNTKELIAEKTSQMENLVSQLANISNPTASEFLVKKIESLSSEIDNLKLDLDKEEMETNENKVKMLNYEIVLATLKEFNRGFDKLESIEKKRIMLETIVEKVTWDGNTGEVDIKLWGSKKK